MQLHNNHIHFWFSYPDKIIDKTLIQKYLELLTDEEHEKYKRYIYDIHRHQYLITRALVKSTLSHYIPEIEPKHWKFEKNRWGRPEIIEEQNSLNLRFNLTHTDGLIGCAVTLNNDIGVDVEDIYRDGETTKIAHRFFSPAEVTELKSLSEEMQRDRFFDYWTLKESYIKAKGMGLAIPLRHFSFSFTKNNTVDIKFAAELEDDNKKWNFCTVMEQDRYKISFGIKHNSKPEILYKQVIPLQYPSATSLTTVYPFK